MRSFIKTSILIFTVLFVTLLSVKGENDLGKKVGKTINLSSNPAFTLSTEELGMISQEKLDSISSQPTAVQQRQDLRYVNNVYTLDEKTMWHMDSVSQVKFDLMSNFISTLVENEERDFNERKSKEKLIKERIFPLLLALMTVSILWLVLCLIVSSNERRDWFVGRSISAILVVVSLIFTISLLILYPNLISTLF